jgi:hypothetical protein
MAQTWCSEGYAQKDHGNEFGQHDEGGVCPDNGGVPV